MGRAKEMMMEFEEADRNELRDLIDRNLENELAEIISLIEEQQDNFNDIISKLTEELDEWEEIDESELDEIIEEIKYLSSSRQNILEDIDRREELKEILNY